MESTQRRNNAGILWFVFLAGPVLWIIDLMVGYPIAAIGCDAHFMGATVLLHLLTLACAAGTAVAGVVAWRRWQASGAGEMSVAGGGGRSGTFMELAGILMSVLFFVLILFEDVAIFVLRPCVGIT